MLDQISAFLKDNPSAKARTIGLRLGIDRTELNRLLHDYPDRFEKDSEFKWSLVPVEYRIEFGGNGWLTSGDFDRALSSTSPLTSRHTAVVLVLKDGCKPLLEFVARLLAFCNQMVAAGKVVTLNFKGSKKTLSYLDRIGFFDVLDQAIDVLPQRPKSNLSKTYQGNNDGVIEFRLIDPNAPDTEIPSLLRNSFVRCAGDSYWHGAFTVLAELFSNVLEHSGTASPGFACLQFYPKGRKIQAVISDNGRGIVSTLAPVVPEKYPQIVQTLASAQHSGVALLTEVFKSGGFSTVDEDGRGCGLKRSGDIAKKFRAKISVRQSDFELRVYHDHNGVQFGHRLNLAHLDGTHICFEFKLDAGEKSA